jgi:transcriptional regulator of arginine metabolism
MSPSAAKKQRTSPPLASRSANKAPTKLSSTDRPAAPSKRTTAKSSAVPTPVAVTKTERQGRIVELIGEHGVTNQQHVVELLAALGIAATQATVSRDLDELGAVKVRTPGGDSVYAIAEFAPDRIAPWEQLRRVMGEWVAEVEHSHNIVVIRTPPGCAHVVASALDRSRFPGLLGTVAGDDTMMCIATESVGGAQLAAELSALAGRMR